MNALPPPTFLISHIMRHGSSSRVVSQHHTIQTFHDTVNSGWWPVSLVSGVCCGDRVGVTVNGKDRPPENFSSIKAASPLAGRVAINAPWPLAVPKAAATREPAFRKNNLLSARTLSPQPLSSAVSARNLENQEPGGLGRRDRTGTSPEHAPPWLLDGSMKDPTVSDPTHMKGKKPFSQDTCEKQISLSSVTPWLPETVVKAEQKWGWVVRCPQRALRSSDISAGLQEAAHVCKAVTSRRRPGSSHISPLADPEALCQPVMPRQQGHPAPPGAEGIALHTRGPRQHGRPPGCRHWGSDWAESSVTTHDQESRL